MHHLLERQLRRLLGPDAAVPAALLPVLALVSDTYAQNDADRALLEHSLQTVSEELVERYQRLETQKAQQQALEQERRRGVELALLNAISSLALTPTDPDEVLRDIVALMGPVAGASRAEAWRQKGSRWECVVDWPPAHVPILRRSADEIAAAVSLLREATAAEEVRVLEIAGPELRQERILLASTGASNLTFGDELVAALEQQVSAVLRHTRTAKALHDNAELLRGVTRGTADVVFAQDRGGRYVMINPAGVRLFGRSEDEILGATDAEVLGWELGAVSRAEDERILRTGLPMSVERKFGTGAPRSLLVRKAPLRNQRGEIVGVVGVATDLTDRKELEAQLLQSQKMEALGRLAGGVAHDFNNLLTVIRGNLELIGFSEELPEPDLESVTSALEATERASDLTSRLLAFGRRSILQATVFDLSELLRGVEPMIRRLIGEDIAIHLDLAAEGMRVRADRGQMEQLVLNLVVNARDAMPGGGALTITTRRTELGEEAAGYIGMEQGPHVLLRVEDTGTGMDEATRARIFEPFFTTKAPGRGSGLGLSMVYGCVQASHGHISLRTAQNEGTAFEILLPMSQDAPAAATTRASRDVAPVGIETILLVEDEASVRTLASRMLTASGYTVIEAVNGTDALRVAQEFGGPIDLLLSDVVMPGMGGGELWRRIGAERPNLRVLFMSGYTDDDMVRAGILREQYRFLPKPFGQRDLLHAVRDALEGDPSRAPTGQ